MKIPPSLLRYWLAMNASAFDASVHSCVTFFGVAGAHAAVDAIPALSLQQFAAVFAITFGRACLSYLDAHPVSELVGRVTPCLSGRQACAPLADPPARQAGTDAPKFSVRRDLYPDAMLAALPLNDGRPQGPTQTLTP